MDLDVLEEIMSSRDFNRYIELCETEEEVYTPEWFELEEMKEDILEKYGLEDIYEMESDEDEDEDEGDYYEDDY